MVSNVSWWKYLKSFYHDVIIFGQWTSVLYSKTKHTFKSDNEVYVTQFILRILCHKIVHAVLNLTERDPNLKFLHSNIMSHHNDQLYSNYTGCMKRNKYIPKLEYISSRQILWNLYPIESIWLRLIADNSYICNNRRRHWSTSVKML